MFPGAPGFRVPGFPGGREAGLSRIVGACMVVAMLGAACDGGSGSAGAGGTATADLDRVSFAAAVEKSTEARFRVVLRSQDPSGTVTESVFAQDPPRQAMIHPDGRMIWDGEHSIICTGEPAQTRCAQMGDLEVGLANLGFEAVVGGMLLAHRSLVASADTLAGWEETRTTIAGRPAVCVEFDEAPFTDFPLDGAARICADAEVGVIVLMESLDAGGRGQRWEAAQVGEPRPEDFEPPVEPAVLTVPDPGDLETPGIPDVPDVPDPQFEIG